MFERWRWFQWRWFQWSCFWCQWDCCKCRPNPKDIESAPYILFVMPELLSRSLGRTEQERGGERMVWGGRAPLFSVNQWKRDEISKKQEARNGFSIHLTWAQTGYSSSEAEVTQYKTSVLTFCPLILWSTPQVWSPWCAHSIKVNVLPLFVCLSPHGF